MNRTSLNAPTTITPITPAQGSNPTTATPSLTAEQCRSRLQHFVDQKDWGAMQRLLTEHPETFRSDVHDLVPRPSLILSLRDTRELGDFAEHFPPSAWMPNIVIREADLSGEDTRIQSLTAHRYSYGLSFENCLLGDATVDHLIEGARQARRAGHVGLRELGWTNSRRPHVNGLFSSELSPDAYNANLDRCAVESSNLDELIKLSPSLKTFAVSGQITVTLDHNDPQHAAKHTLISLDNLLGALGGTPLQQLHLDNICQLNFMHGEDGPVGLGLWRLSKTIALSELKMTRWCLEGTNLDPDTEASERALLSTEGLRRKDGGPLLVICDSIHDASEAALTLAETLAARNTPTTVCWKLKGQTSDETWASFANRLFNQSDERHPVFRERLSLDLIRPHREDLARLAAGLESFYTLESLTLSDQRLDQDAYKDVVLTEAWIENTESMILSMEQQPYLRRLDFGQELLGLKLSVGACRSRLNAQIDALNAQTASLSPPAGTDESLDSPVGEMAPYLTDMQSQLQELNQKLAALPQTSTETMERRYKNLQSWIQREVRLDQIAWRMPESGLDLGHAHPLDRDVSTAVISHLGSSGTRGELGEAVLAIALTNHANYAAWEMASRKV